MTAPISFYTLPRMASPRPSSPSDPSPGTAVEIQRDPDVPRFTLDNPGHENAVTGAMFDAMLAELRSEAVRPLARVLRLIIGLLSVQIIVVALFGVKPKKHRLEELDSESPLSPLPSQV